jgi:hypothetical protein
VVLYADQALSHAQALAFCQAKHGASSGLPSGSAMTTAQQLLQSVEVGGHLLDGWR